jgi:hypothetical protein
MIFAGDFGAGAGAGLYYLDSVLGGCGELAGGPTALAGYLTSTIVGFGI